LNFTTGISTITLSSGGRLTGISDVQGGIKYYMINVPTGQTALSVKISGGSGNCDLYVRYAALPTSTEYYIRPYLNGNLELANITAPAAGAWYIMLRGASSYSNVSLQVEYGQDLLTTSLLYALSGALGYRLDSEYYQGRKIMTYVSAGWTYGIDISLVVYLDLADYVQVTEEGWNGNWVTIWGRSNFGAFGASALPVTLGVLERAFSSTELPDREFPLETSIFGGTIGPVSVSFLNTSDGNFSPADFSLEAVEVNASWWAFSVTTPSISVEIQRSNLDALFSNALVNTVVPGAYVTTQFINFLITHLVGNIGQNSSFVWAVPVRVPSDMTDASN
jgi:hypothetical protein